MRPKETMYANVCIGKLKTKVSESLKKQLRGVAQLGSAGALGALGRRFESCRPDQSETGFPACLFYAKFLLSPKVAPKVRWNKGS